MGSLLRCAAAALVLACSAHAQAALEARDGSFGAGTVIHDDATGLDWLRLDITRGMSFQQIAAGLDDGGQFDDWRWAQRDEVVALFTSTGVSNEGSTPNDSPAEVQAARAFGDMFTYVTSETQSFLWGLFEPAVTGGSVSHLRSAGMHWDTAGAAWFNDGTNVDPHAAWLVAEQAAAPVPEPATYALMALGLVALLTRCRRHDDRLV